MPGLEDRQELFCALAALYTGGRHDHVKDQLEGIDEGATLAAVDRSARGVAPEPSASVVLTD